MGKTTRTPITVPCSICETAFTLPPSKRAYWRKSGRAVCSPECRMKSAVATGRRTVFTKAECHARSVRLTTNNPMRDPLTRAKVSATLKAIGHRPSVRGGNGRGPSEPQRLLAEALGWPMEVSIGTGPGARASGRATCYKLDIGNPTLKVGVEVDGSSHSSLKRREEDRRKVEFLNGEGWTVLRFSNREVMADTAGCAQTVLSTISR